MDFIFLFEFVLPVAVVLFAASVIGALVLSTTVSIYSAEVSKKNHHGTLLDPDQLEDYQNELIPIPGFFKSLSISTTTILVSLFSYIIVNYFSFFDSLLVIEGKLISAFVGFFVLITLLVFLLPTRGNQAAMISIILLIFLTCVGCGMYSLVWLVSF